MGSLKASRRACIICAHSASMANENVRVEAQRDTGVLTAANSAGGYVNCAGERLKMTEVFHTFLSGCSRLPPPNLIYDQAMSVAKVLGDDVQARLSDACFYGSYNAVEAALEDGADATLAPYLVYVTTYNDKCGNRVSIAKLLLKHDAGMNATWWGFTPALQAAKSGLSDVLRVLLKAGAKETVSSDGLNLLHYAVKSADVATVKTVLELAPHLLNVPDEFDQTALSHARNSDVKKHLIEAGAAVTTHADKVSCRFDSLEEPVVRGVFS